MPKKILIAEDDKALARSIGRMLESDGYVCEFATEGDSAVSLAKAGGIDLIILDLLLPKRDGWGVLEALRGDKDEVDTKVIVVSGVFRGRTIAKDVTKAGGHAFFAKPFSDRALLDQILELIGPAVEPDKPRIKVSLREQPPASVLWTSMSVGFSGAVQFRQGKLHKVLILKDGKPLLIRSNLAKECLGRRLLLAGRIDRTMLDESIQRARDDDERQGEILVSMGALTDAELAQELKEQSEEKILSLFSWSSGKAWVQEGITTMNHASPVRDWAATELTLHGAQRMTNAQLAYALHPVLKHPVVRLEQDLSDVDLAVPGVSELLAALEPGSTVADLIGTHAAAIFGLWTIGVLSLNGKGVASPEESKLVELREQYERAKQQTYFEVLGVDRSAGAPEIKKAFIGLAKTYHPDKYRNESENVRRVAGDIFAVMSAAHDTLSQPETRIEYLSRLDGSGAESRHTEVARILKAEGLFQDAEAMVGKRDFAGAEVRLRNALEFKPDEGEYLALLGWCLFMRGHEDQQSIDAAVHHLEQGIRLAPGSTNGYYYLAKLRKVCGEDKLAQKMFRKVLEIDPRHAEATRETRLANMRKKKSGGGLFGFGRKKK